MGFFQFIADQSLWFVNEDDSWEELWVEVYSDSDLNDNPRSTGRDIVLLCGLRESLCDSVELQAAQHLRAPAPVIARS